MIINKENPITYQMKTELFLYCVYSQNIMYYAMAYMCHNYKRIVNTIHI